MRLAQGPQRSDAGEARTRGPSVSSQALYHWATALPATKKKFSVLGGVRIVALSVSSREQTQLNQVSCFLMW